MALVGAFLTDSSVDKVAITASAGESYGVEDGTSCTSGAFGWVSCLTNIAEKGRAREALEGCGGVKVVASKASASAVVGVVEEAGLSVTGNTERKDQRDIESSLIRAA